MRLPRLPADPSSPFPPVQQALREPDGLLAWGGDLSPTRLLNAYRHGIFPWYSDGDPILWWSPDPRMVFDTATFRLSRRDARSLTRRDWKIRADHHFDAVISACASLPRNGQNGTWIDASMLAAYVKLHRLGHAHSIEVRDVSNRLVGGLYGISIGRVFFGESMVSLVSGGSKVALAALCHRLREWNYPILDAQVESPHLLRMGATSLTRRDFSAILQRETAHPEPVGDWRSRFGELHSADLEMPHKSSLV